MTGSLGPLILSITIFGLTYVGILTEKVHRTLVALVGGAAMVCIGAWSVSYTHLRAHET